MRKHLIITGKNGSGKTILLNAIVEHLSKVCNDETLRFLDLKKDLKSNQTWLQQAENTGDSKDIATRRKSIEYYKARIEAMYGKVELHSMIYIPSPRIF